MNFVTWALSPREEGPTPEEERDELKEKLEEKEKELEDLKLKLVKEEKERAALIHNR